MKLHTSLFCRVFSRQSNYFNVFALFLWSRDIEFWAVQSRNFKLCIALLSRLFMELYLKYFRV